MKIALYFFFFLIGLSAQAQQWNWVQHQGLPTLGGDGYSVATDSSANAYVAGQMDFKSKIGSYVNPYMGWTYFIAKYDPLGNVVWVHNEIPYLMDTVWSGIKYTDIAADAAGNCYTTGYFSGFAVFGSDTIKAGGLSDCFFAKYSTNGNLVWVRTWYHGGDVDNGFPTLYMKDSGEEVSVDESGNCFMTGHTLGPIDSTLVPGNSFLVKFDTAGTFQWMSSFPLPLPTGIRPRLSADNLGGCYLMAGHNSTSGTNYQSLIARFLPGGDTAWMRSTKFPDLGLHAVSLAADKFGNVYAAGDSGIISFDTSGTLRWQTPEVNAFVEDLSVSPDGNLLGAAGWFKNQSSLLPGVSAHYHDAFAAVYQTQNGNLAYAEHIGSSSGSWMNEYGQGVSILNNGQVYVTGNVSSPASFGSITMPLSTGSSTFNYFLAKLMPPVVFGTDEELAAGSLAAYPNPFSECITFQYQLLQPGKVQLSVYDALGRKVAAQQRQSAVGSHELRWESGELSPGLYHAVLEAGGRGHARPIMKE